MRRVLFLLSAVVLVSLTGPATVRAAWLSEVFLGTAGEAEMPRAIEISSLAEPGDLELVIMEAGNVDRLGTVSQVIRFETTEALHLLSDGDWPSTRWTEILATLPPAVLLDLEQVTGGVHTQLDLAGPRRIHLYAGHTRIEPGAALLAPGNEALLRGDAVLLDVLTLADAGQAATLHEDETIVDTSDGEVLLRPGGFQDVSSHEQWLVGSPDAHGYLSSIQGPVKATPGQTNPHFDEIHMPEPSSLTMAMAALGMFMHRRRARPAWLRCRITGFACGGGRARHAGRRRAR